MIETSIYSLPRELLVAIFKFVTQPVDYYDYRTTLALVSREFNALVYNTPSLWTNIGGGRSPYATSHALSRSGNLPINVRFYMHQTSEAALPSILKSFELVCRHIQRWRTADLAFDGYQGLPERLTSPAPLLEQLVIRYAALPEDSASLINLFGGRADRLTSVVLDCTSVSMRGGPFTNLHILKLIDVYHPAPSVEDIMAILSASPKLSVLKLKGISFPGTLPLEPTTVHLPLLRDLHLSHLVNPITSYILRHIHSPACKRFTVGCQLDDDTDASEFMALLHPFIPPSAPETATFSLNVGKFYIDNSLSYCPGRKLRISLAGVPATATLPHFLSTIPPAYLELETSVSVADMYSPDNALMFIALVNDVFITSLDIGRIDTQVDAILRPLGQSSSLPSLRKLTLDINGVTPGALTRMMKSRIGNWGERRGPLNLLSVCGAGRRHEVDRIAIEALLGLERVAWGRSEDAEEG